MIYLILILCGLNDHLWRKMEKIIIAGFGYSGSSAIVDYLYDCTNVTGFYMDYPSETNILNKKIVDDYIDFIENRKIQSLNIYDIAMLVSGGSTGYLKAINFELNSLFISNHLSTIYDKRMLRIISEMELNEYYVRRENPNIINLTEEILDSIVKQHYPDEQIDVNKFKQNYIRFVELLLQSHSLFSSKTIIFNNDTHIWKKDSYFDVGYLGSILVFRNPLDQYARNLDMFDLYHLTLYRRLKFLIKFLFNYNYEILVATIYSKKNNYFFISFEDFLLKENIRESIIKKLNLIKYTKSSSKVFDINYSLKGINSYKNILPYYEIILIRILSCIFYRLAKFSQIY